MKRWRWLMAMSACLLGSALPVMLPGVASAASTAAESPFALTVDTSTPYVQAQVMVSLRFTRSIGHYPLTSFLLSQPPDLDQNEAIVKPLEFRTSREVLRRNGVRYLVTTWRYALFPQMPGDMTIGPVTINARATRADGYAGFEAFRTAPMRLHVRPIPKGFTGDVWLPAKSVHVYQGFNPDQSSLPVGSPISRRLAMTFDGAQKGELPAFTGAAVAGLEVHPLRPRRAEQSTSAGLTATLEQQIALTPTQTGQLTIPSLEVPWWNTVKDREEIARFPGYTLTVTPAPPGWDAGKAAPGGAHAAAGAQPSTASRSSTLLVWTVAIPALILVLILAAVLVVLTRNGGLPAFAKLGRRWRRACRQSALGRRWHRLRLERRLAHACAANDASRAAQVLADLASIAAPGTARRSLRQLATTAAAPLGHELLALNAALYGAGTADWRGAPLMAAFRHSQKFRVGRKEHLAHSGLPLLHPLANGEPVAGDRRR